jgi:ATP-dependent phosphofructokinase / diphosphate-dependent phosphofructokinase
MKTGFSSYNNRMAQRIGILTAGSDVPGLNAAIRAFGKAATNAYGMKLIGFQDGFEGLIDDRSMPIHNTDLSNILTSGGTFLGTSRRHPKNPQQPGHSEKDLQYAADTYRRHRLDGLVIIGGREAIDTGHQFAQMELNVITLPKAIDNHIPQTDFSIGFRTALEVSTEAIDRLHSTAHSHHRIIIVELMGAVAGWLALTAGLAGGADVILLPEIPYDISRIASAIQERNDAGKRFSIIAVAESARTLESVQFFQNARRVNDNLHSGEDRDLVANRLVEIEARAVDSTMLLANRLGQLTHLDTRVTILGYLLRGGSPSGGDRVLAAQLGTACAEMVSEGNFGIMVAAQGQDSRGVALKELVNQVNLVPTNHPWIQAARKIGTHFGD